MKIIVSMLHPILMLIGLPMYLLWLVVGIETFVFGIRPITRIVGLIVFLTGHYAVGIGIPLVFEVMLGSGFYFIDQIERRHYGSRS